MALDTKTPQHQHQLKTPSPKTQFDGRTGEWARQLHLKATDGCTDPSKTGGKRFVL